MKYANAVHGDGGSATPEVRSEAFRTFYRPAVMCEEPNAPRFCRSPCDEVSRELATFSMTPTRAKLTAALTIIIAAGFAVLMLVAVEHTVLLAAGYGCLGASYCVFGAVHLLRFRRFHHASAWGVEFASCFLCAMYATVALWGLEAESRACFQASEDRVGRR